MAKEKKVTEIVEIPIHFILPDHNQPRANFEEVDCIELAKSIKQHGLLQPIMVRPMSGIEPLKYLVVYGHRRLWAAKYLRWETIPAQVKELTEDEAFEFQIIENLQRVDINPMDESDSFQKLVKKGMFNAEIIADKIGKSQKYVYDRLILQEVIPAMQSAVRVGKFSISHAKQLAKITPEDQNRLWAVISNKNSAEIEPAYIRRLINDTFKLKLGDAIFPTGDSQLKPAAGSCLTCKKRSGARQLLFDDFEQYDVCFDLDCWKEKETAQIDRMIEMYKAEGKEVKLLAAGYSPKDSMLIEEPKWRFHVQEKESNIIGIIVEMPAWSQNKVKIGDIVWLSDQINKVDSSNEEEEMEEDVVDEYEGLTEEETLVKKKESGIMIKFYDMRTLLSKKLLEKVIDSYQRGAFQVEAINQYLRMQISKQRLNDETIEMICNAIGSEFVGDNQDKNFDVDAIDFEVKNCEDNTEKLLELLALLDMSRIAEVIYSESDYKKLNDNFPDILFHESLAEVEELAGRKMFQ